MGDTPDTLQHTPLWQLHRDLGARMVPFAGYDMPVQYPAGVLKEHLHTRAQAGLFDVSHMGQAWLAGPDHATVARALEALVPADIVNLKPGQQRYSQLLNAEGGIIDDLMVTRPADPAEAGRLFLVVNASRKEVDYAWITARLPEGVRLERADDRALIALQGPDAEEVVSDLGAQEAAGFTFMQAGWTALAGHRVHVSRSGYTGEDGFEISIAAAEAPALWSRLLEDERVSPVGLGARDSLRLEAGLCLYGHDIDETTSPIEAALQWSIQKRRREEGGFPGASRIQRELREGIGRRRVGIRTEGRAPAREGTPIVTPDGKPLGTVTSGGFGPTLNAPVAMGYVAASHAGPGVKVGLVVRGQILPATIVPMPFVPNRYVR